LLVLFVYPSLLVMRSQAEISLFSLLFKHMKNDSCMRIYHDFPARCRYQPTRRIARDNLLPASTKELHQNSQRMMTSQTTRTYRLHRIRTVIRQVIHRKTACCHLITVRRRKASTTTTSAGRSGNVESKRGYVYLRVLDYTSQKMPQEIPANVPSADHRLRGLSRTTPERRRPSRLRLSNHKALLFPKAGPHMTEASRETQWLPSDQTLMIGTRPTSKGRKLFPRTV
jgi:hypothetical protein